MDGNLTPDKAQEFLDSLARKDMKYTALNSLLLGAGLRSVLAIPEVIKFNQQRTNAKRKAEQVSPSEFIFNTGVKAAQAPASAPAVPSTTNTTASYPLPAKYYPAMLAAALLPALGGWYGTGALVKAHKRKIDDEDLDTAEKSFDAALKSERGTKFAAMLDDLADEYIRGEVQPSLDTIAQAKQADASPLGNWTTPFTHTIPGVLATLATLSAALGGYAGWNMAGNTAEKEDIKKYKEQKQRSEYASPSPIKAYQVKDAGVNWGALGKRVLPYIGGAAKWTGSAALGGALSSWLATNTDIGRNWIAARAGNAMSSPTFMQNQIDNFLKNPAAMKAIRERLMPAMEQQFAQRHPILSTLTGIGWGQPQYNSPSATMA